MSTEAPVVQPVLHVVVSCKSRKTISVPTETSASALRATSLDDRLREWIGAIDNASCERTAAGRLYAGDHWKVVLKIPTATRGKLDVRLWVASAGYGLVRIDSPLAPYSATFIRSHRESVVPRNASFDARQWWDGLANWQPHAGMPRRLRDIAAAMTSADYMLLALSEPYAWALEDDIAAAGELANGRIGLISVGRSESSIDSLSGIALKAESRLKREVGGAMQGINARIAHRVVESHAEWFPRTDRLDAVIASWTRELAPLERFNRARMSDEELKDFIRSDRASHAPAKSGALRRLRDSGLACEQARFGRLFVEVSRELMSADNSVEHGKP